MIRWADSFDHYGSNIDNLLDGSWAELFLTVDLSTDQARTGTRSLLIPGNNGVARRVFGGALVSAGVGAAFFFPFLPSTNACWRVFGFMDSNNQPQVSIFLDSTGQLSCYRGDGSEPAGVLLGLSDGDVLMTARSWNHLEAKCSPAVSGSVEVRLNGVTILNLAGVNTINSTSPALGEASTSQISFGPVFNLTGFDGYLDDVIAWDTTGTSNNNFVGDKKVFTDFPDADTAEVDWTPKTGATRFAMIDEQNPDGDTTYDYANDAGERMGVSFPDINAATIAISAICLIHKSKKTDAGDCNVTVSAHSGADEDAGHDRPMTTLYTNYFDAFEVDPATDAPWTKTAANAMTAIVERTA